MQKFWLVFKYEYLRHVKRKRFLLTVLSVPLMIIVVMAISVIASFASTETRPAGYVDEAGFITRQLPQSEPGFLEVDLVAYPDEAAARADLEAKKIHLYFVIPADYRDTHIVRQVSLESVESSADSQLTELLQYNLLASYPADVTRRVMSGPKIEIRSTETGQAGTVNSVANFVLPLLTGILFMIVINTSGGYLLQAVVEEKENRTMEIMVTSVSPVQLMAGKTAGNLSVGLTQLFIWLGIAGVGLIFAIKTLPFARDITVSPSFIWLTILAFIPAFIMVAAMMAMTGAVATEASEAQQVAGLFTLPFFIPYWFIALIMENPDGPIAVGMSLFPLTAPTTLPLRASLTSIPWWQTAVALVLLYLSAIGAMWLAGRAFRMGMLRYGKRLKIKELFLRKA